MNEQTSDKSDQKLPCVVQLGFAGARRLFDPAPDAPETEQKWEQKLHDHLRDSLKQMRSKMKLSDESFFCGISQIAVGADMVFARVMTESDLPHRIFLPQPVEDYLTATGSQGDDFSAAEKQQARRLLDAENIIQTTTVSHSTDRHARFRETNAEILRVSDVVVTVIKKDAETKPGGSNEFIKRALAIGKPVLEICVSVKDNQPVFENDWHLKTTPPYRPPGFPVELDKVRLEKPVTGIPSCDEFTSPLKEMTGLHSRSQQKRFKNLVVYIIAFHILATALATAAISMHGSDSSGDEPASGIVAAANHANVPEDGDAGEEQVRDGGAATPDSSAGQHHRSIWSWLIPLLLIGELVALLLWG